MKTPALYFADVVHRRLRAPRHQLNYKLAYLSFMLDDLPTMQQRLRLFGTQRRLFTFRVADYGAETVHDLAGIVRTQGARLGADVAGPVRVITLPRVFGFGFNPISLFVLHNAEGQESAVVYDVRNTFGERHYYAAALHGHGGARHVAAKRFHVSPFLPVDGSYRFNLAAVGADLHFAVTKTGPDGVDLYTRLTGAAAPLSDRVLARALLGVPVQGALILGAIHWEALKMVLKRAAIYAHPASAGAAKKARRKVRLGLASWFKGAHTISALKGGAFK